MPFKIIPSTKPNIYTELDSNSQSNPSNKNSASRIHKVHRIPSTVLLVKKINRETQHVLEDQLMRKKMSDNKIYHQKLLGCHPY